MKKISRRKFVGESALAFASISFLPNIGLEKKSTTSDPINAGIIGMGNRGTGLAVLMQKIPAFRVVACCDILPDKLANGIKQGAPAAKSYQRYHALLDDKMVDAVFIATPLFLHYQMAIDAINAGKHVYLEKSLTYDIPQTISLVKKVNASKLVFQVGYQYRYYSLYHKIKEVIAKNWLGKITHFECQYNRNSNWRNPVSNPKLERTINWRMYREYCGGPLSELCAHELDMVNYLLDSHPKKVTGIGGINYWKDGRDTYDNIRAIYEYPNDIKASFTSVLSNAYNGYNIKILGDKATIEIQREKAFVYAESTENKRGIVDGVTGATIEATTQGKPVEILFKKPGEEDTEPTIFALQDFLECIRTGKKPLSNVVNAAESSIAIHMGNAAMDTETFQTWKPEYSI